MVLGRDHFKCNYCSATDYLQVDHIKPCAAGGTADVWNLQALCRECNLIKGSSYPRGVSYLSKRYIDWKQKKLDISNRDLHAQEMCRLAEKLYLVEGINHRDRKSVLVEAYNTYLYEFLSSAEKDALRTVVDNWIYGWGLDEPIDNELIRRTQRRI